MLHKYYYSNFASFNFFFVLHFWINPHFLHQYYYVNLTTFSICSLPTATSTSICCLNYSTLKHPIMSYHCHRNPTLSAFWLPTSFFLVFKPVPTPMYFNSRSPLNLSKPSTHNQADPTSPAPNLIAAILALSENSLKMHFLFEFLNYLQITHLSGYNNQ